MKNKRKIRRRYTHIRVYLEDGIRFNKARKRKKLSQPVAFKRLINRK